MYITKYCRCVCVFPDTANVIVTVAVAGFNFILTSRSTCSSTIARWSATARLCARFTNARKTKTDFCTWSTHRRRHSAESAVSVVLFVSNRTRVVVDCGYSDGNYATGSS